MKQTFKNIGRLEEIVAVLLRNGFGHFVDRLNLKGHLALKGSVGKEAKHLTQAERIRKSFEELGPTLTSPLKLKPLESRVSWC